MKKWDELSLQEKSYVMQVGISNNVKTLGGIKGMYNTFAQGGKLNDTYQVKKGDSIWRIAHNHGISMDDLRKWNPQIKKDLIHPEDIVNIRRPEGRKETVYEDVNNVRSRELELNKDNISAIQGKRHKDNYIIIDKLNSKLSVFDKDNNKLYETDRVATGKSGDDYNTVTYTNSFGRLLNNKGNNSTPAGITQITGKGKYHQLPSFTRGRYNPNTKEYDDIAASMHFGNIGNNRKVSNGCVRLDGKTLCDIEDLVNVGTNVYTLPEKEGSRFELRDGKLNYIADNPYGEQEGDKKYWDDYNVHNNREFKPLKIIDKKDTTEDYEYSGNRLQFGNIIAGHKEGLQKKFNIDSDTYNRIAELAMGIAEQETKFGTSTRKMIKDNTPDFILNYVRGNKNRSKGITQIKLAGDNKEMQQIYNEFGINEDNIDDINKSATATILRLLYMYNSEVRGRKFKNNPESVSEYDALLYKWMGRNTELRNKTATPSKNNYINNVKKYIKDFEFLSGTEHEYFD